MLEALSHSAVARPVAVKLTLKAAWQHERFREFVEQADHLRDHGRYNEAEDSYRKALRLFPLHWGYRIQLAHVLKSQGKPIEAFVHYFLALGGGAPEHDVTEHLTFVARLAEIRLGQEIIDRVVAAGIRAERTLDNWDAPPIESDFVDFAKLFWGNTGLVTPTLMQGYLLKCTNRKQLFVAFLRSNETLRHNPRLFILMRERGLKNV